MSELTLYRVHGAGATGIGYGRFGLKLGEAIERQGVELFDRLDNPNQPTFAGNKMHGDKTGKTNVVGWVSTPGHARGWHDGQYSVLATMFETNRIPEAYREHLYAFDLLVVPSAQNVELFSQFHPNVKLAYLGVDPTEWFYVPRKAPETEFRFLIAGSGDRKGQQLAVDAFRKVFKTWPKDGPVPKLVMKSPKGGDFYHDRIEMVSGRITDQEERDLYASCHVNLAPSKGEGFGLQPLQAMAQGMPTILTNAHGHASFAHLGYGLSTTTEKANYFIYGEAGDWWLPSFDDLCMFMEYTYQNWDAAEATGRAAAEVVARDFTWDQTATKFLDAIGRDRLELPYAGDGSWFAPKHRLYPVRVMRPFSAEIAGINYQWTPGETYYEVADVKRILFEAGNILDVSCVEVGDEDTGLAPEQVAALGLYSARHAFCSSCHQKLGSGVTLADELYAEMQAAVDA